MTARGCGCCGCRSDAISFAVDLFTPKIIAFHRRKYKLLTIVQETFSDYDEEGRRISEFRDYETVSETTEDVEKEFTTRPDQIIAGTLIARANDIYKYETYKEEKNEDTGVTRKFFRRTIFKMVDGVEEIKCAAEIDVSQVFLFGKKFGEEDRIRSFFQDLNYRTSLIAPSGSALFSPPGTPDYYDGSLVRLSFGTTSDGALDEDVAHVDVGMKMDESLPEDEEGFDSIHNGQEISWKPGDRIGDSYNYFAQFGTKINLLPVLPSKGKHDTAVLTFFSEEKGSGYQSAGDFVLSSHDFEGSVNRDIGKGKVDEDRLVLRAPAEAPDADFPTGVNFYLSSQHNWSKAWKRIGDEEYITKNPLQPNSVLSLNNIVSTDFWNSHGEDVYLEQDKKLVVEFIDSETDKTIAKQEFFVRPWANRLDDFIESYDGKKGSILADNAIFEWTEGSQSYREAGAFVSGQMDFSYRGHLSSGDDLSDLSNCSNAWIQNSYSRTFSEGFGNYFQSVWDGSHGYTPQRGQFFTTDGSSVSCRDGTLQTSSGGLLLTLVDPQNFVKGWYVGGWDQPYRKYGIETKFIFVNKESTLVEFSDVSYGSPSDNCETGVISGCYDAIDGYYEWLLSSSGSWGDVDHYSAKEASSSVRTVDGLDSVSNIVSALKGKFGEDASLTVGYPSFSFGIPKRVGGADRLDDHLSAVLAQREASINGVTLCDFWAGGVQVVFNESEFTTLEDFAIDAIDKAQTFRAGGGYPRADLFSSVGASEVAGVIDVSYMSSDVVFPFSSYYHSGSGLILSSTGPGKFRIRDSIIELENCKSGVSSYDWKHIETNHDGVPLHVKFRIEAKDPRPEAAFTYDVKDVDGEKNVKCDEHGCSVVHPYNTVDFTVKSSSMGSLSHRELSSEYKNGCRSEITHGSLSDIYENVDSFGGIIYDQYSTKEWTYYQPSGLEDFVEPGHADVLSGQTRLEGPEGYSIGVVYPFLDSLAGESASGLLRKFGPQIAFSAYIDDSEWEQDKISTALKYTGNNVLINVPEALAISGFDAKFPNGGGEKPDAIEGVTLLGGVDEPNAFTVRIDSCLTTQRIESVSDYSFNKKYSLKTVIEVSDYEPEEDEALDPDAPEKVRLDVECTIGYGMGEWVSGNYPSRELPHFSTGFRELLINPTSHLDRIFRRTYSLYYSGIHGFHRKPFGEIPEQNLTPISAAEVQQYHSKYADPALIDSFPRQVVNWINYCEEWFGGEVCSFGGYPFVKRNDSFLDTGLYSLKWFSDELSLSDFWTGQMQVSLSRKAVRHDAHGRDSILLDLLRYTGETFDYSGVTMRIGGLDWQFGGRHYLYDKNSNPLPNLSLISDNPIKGGARQSLFADLINEDSFRIARRTLKWSKVVDKWENNEIPELTFSVGDDDFVSEWKDEWNPNVISGIHFEVTSSDLSGLDNRSNVAAVGLYPAVDRDWTFADGSVWGGSSQAHSVIGDAFKWRGSYSLSELPISEFQITIGGPDQ